MWTGLLPNVLDFNDSIEGYYGAYLLNCVSMQPMPDFEELAV